MFRNLFVVLIVLGIVSCSNVKPKEEEIEKQDVPFVSQYEKFDNYGITFEYPADYIIEEKIIEEGHYFKVYLTKDDDTMYREVQIEWRNNSIKYDPINGRKEGAKSLVNFLGSKVKTLRNYETNLNEEKVYWADYVIDEDGVQIFQKTGITRICDYVFVIQIMSDIDDEDEEANKIFKSIRVTGNKVE